MITVIMLSRILWLPTVLVLVIVVHFWLAGIATGPLRQESPTAERKTKLSGHSTTMGDVMHQRTLHLHHQCQTLGLAQEPLQPPRSYISHFQKKAIFTVCTGPKGGSSSWYQLGEEVLDMNGTRTRRGPYIRLLGIISVRHPLVRLFSAYRDKFLNGRPISSYSEEYKKKTQSGQTWGKRWLVYWLPALVSTGQVNSSWSFEKLQNWKPRIKVGDLLKMETLMQDMFTGDHLLRLKSQFSGSSFTFMEFLHHVLWTFEVGMVDPHWQSFYTMCQPCVRRYDYVVHLESATEDVGFVLHQASYPKVNVTLPVRHHIKNDSQSDLLVYHQVPRDILDRVIQLYRLDFLLFNYTIPAV